MRALRRLGVQAIFFQDSEQPWYALFKPEAVARHFRNVASAGGWHSCVWASPQAATAGKPPAKQ
ncbi:MAG: hypothetical protein JSV79_01840 [Armatimonadota bacterium]|nr:MAG: hypothetical protein JSV79_01840 [Armatimonadota bacterium]